MNKADATNSFTFFNVIKAHAFLLLLALPLASTVKADDHESPSSNRKIQRLRVAIVSRTFFYVPLWAAIKNGDFAKAGLEIEVSLLGNNSQREPLLHKDIDIAIATPETAIQDAASGGPLRIVAGNNGKPTHSLISRAPFKTIESLRGARIGILNHVEGTYFLLQDMLSKFGLNAPEDYEVVETGGVPLRHEALVKGRIDAGLQSIPWNYMAEELHMNNLGDIINIVPDWQFVSINVNREWAENHSETLILFLSVMLQSTEWVHTHKEEASEIAEHELPTSAEYAKRAWDYYISTNALTRDLSITRRGCETMIDALRKADLISANAPTSIDYYFDGRWLQAARNRIADKR